MTVFFLLMQLEYDNDRSGDFEPLRYLPSDKFVVLGLVTTKHGGLEDAGAVKARIYEAADVLARGSGKTREQALEQYATIFVSSTDGPHLKTDKPTLTTESV